MHGAVEHCHGEKTLFVLVSFPPVRTTGCVMASASCLSKALNIEDMRRIARRRMPAFALAYLESGVEDHVTLSWNQRVFDRWRFVPDTLIDVSQRDLTAMVLGRPEGASGSSSTCSAIATLRPTCSIVPQPPGAKH